MLRYRQLFLYEPNIYEYLENKNAMLFFNILTRNAVF